MTIARTRRAVSAALATLLVYQMLLPAFVGTRPAAAQAPPALAFYLDSDGGECKPNADPLPANLVLSPTAPTTSAIRCKDSAGINFLNGNPWAEVGTWRMTPAPGTLSAIQPLRVFLGLKNSDDQGTNFDLLAEVFRGSTLVAQTSTRCIRDLTRNMQRAREVTLSFPTFPGVSFSGTDVLGLMLSTRIGTNPDGTRCDAPKSHANARGLRVYYDGTRFPSGFGVALGPGSGEPSPSFTSTPPTTAVTTILYSYPLTATDPLARPVTFELVAGPPGMTLVPPGIVRWIPTDAQAGPHPVHVRAHSSATAAVSQQFSVTASRFNRNPTITSVPPTSAIAGTPYTYEAAAFDPERQAIVWSFGQAPPSGMTIDGATGMVRWTPGAGAIGAHPVAIVARDPLGGEDRQAYRLDVRDPAAALEVTSPRGSFSVAAGQTLTLPLSANLPNAAFGVSPTLANLSVGTASATFTPTASQEGTHTLSVTARAGDLRASSVVTITVTRGNQAPQIAAIAPQTVTEGGKLSFTVQVSDADGDPVTVSAPGLTLPGAVFNTFTRQFSFAPGTGQAGPHQVTFAASDGRTSAQREVAITVTPAQSGQQLLNLTVDPPTNPTLSPAITITGSTAGGPSTVPPGASLPAMITGLTPTSLRQGQTGTVQITGLNTQFNGATSRAVFGSGVTVTGFTVQSPTRAEATVQVDTQAAVGVRQVQVSTAAGNVPSVVGFSVTKGAASITGVVVDPVTGQPLASAVVTINGTGITATTDAQGRFTLTGVPPGAVTLLVTLPNYQVVRVAVVVGSNDSVALPDPIKVNALARPPSAGGVLPRSASVASVLDRGIAAVGSGMTVEQAKQAIADTMITVGGEEAGVIDEQGNQLNPKLAGPGLLSLTPTGVEIQARRLLMGQTFRLVDLLFALRGAYGFALQFPNDAELLHGLQRVVDQAWANPDDPASAMPLIMFSTGTIRPVAAPRLSLETRLNSFQSFLFVAGFTARYTAEIDHAITRLAQKAGVPPPPGPASSIVPAPGLGAVFAAQGRSLLRALAALPGLAGPGTAFAQTPEETVAQRRLREKMTFTEAFRALTLINPFPDAVIGGSAALALAWGVATTANMIMGASFKGAAVAAVGRQLAMSAMIGAAFAVLMKMVQVFSLTLATQYMHPDPPITEAASFLSDGTAEIPFQKSVSDTTTETARGRTLYPTEPADGYWTRVGRNIVADWQGLDPRLLTYHYRLYRVRGVDDENIADNRIVPVRPVEILDTQGNVVPGRLKFVVPHEYLQDDINYFRIATYQIYDRGGVPPERPEPFHYRDVLDPSNLPSFFPTLLGYTLSFASGFSTPSPAPPAWNYLTPIFRDAKTQAAQGIIEARKADVLRGLEGAILGPAEQDYLYTKAVVKQHRTHLSQLRAAQQTLLTQQTSTWAALERHAALLNLVGNNPNASWQGVNPVTQQAASVLGVPELPPSTAAALEQLSTATSELSRVSAVKDAMDLYNGKWSRFEADLANAKVQAQQAGIQVTPEAVAEIQIQGRPAFQIQNNILVGEPTFGPNTNVRVIAPFNPATPIESVQVQVSPGVVATIGELKASDLDRTNRLNGAFDQARANLQPHSDTVRGLSGASTADLEVITSQLAENEITQNRVQEELKVAEVAHQETEERFLRDLERVVRQGRQAEATNLQTALSRETRLKAFESRVSALGNVVTFAGIAYMYVDMQRTLKLGAAVMPSELSETIMLARPQGTAGVARIIRDPLVPFGVLSALHDPYRPPDPGSRDRFPVKNGWLELSVYDGHAKRLPVRIVPELGFPSDVFAADSQGRIYTNNANSNANFGGRTFRFTRPAQGTPDSVHPAPPDGEGVVRDYVGSINYNSLDAFRPPLPAEPIAMAIGEYCCGAAGNVEVPFYADIDFDATPPAGRIVRLPVEAKGTTADTRLVGKPWVVSSALELAGPSALVMGHDDHRVGGSATRPLFLSDGPRIWAITQAAPFAEQGLLQLLVNTDGRQWAGLLVDRQGNLYALDKAAGLVWLLPSAAVQAAFGAPLDSPEAFDAAAYRVASGHTTGHDLAGIFDDSGYFVSTEGGKALRQRLPIVGELPAGVTLDRFDVVDELNRRTTVTRYGPGNRRFLALVDPAEARKGSVRFAVTVVGGRERVIDVALPLLGAFVWPREDLAQKLGGVQP